MTSWTEKVRRTRSERSVVLESVGAAYGLKFARPSSPRISLGIEGQGECSRCAALESLFRYFLGEQAPSPAERRRKE